MTRQGARVPPAKASDRHARGIAPYRDGWRVYVRIRGVYRSKVFPGDKKPNELENERENLRVDLRRELEATDRGDTPTLKPEDEPFDVAADRYLPAVKSLRTYAERERDIALWVAAEFGHRTRGTISSAEIRTIRDRWLAHGPRMVQKRSRVAKACRSRRLYSGSRRYFADELQDAGARGVC